MAKTNIVLIGMPGAGKSTFGVVLAKTAAMAFIDTDLLLQNQFEQSLQQQLDSFGYQTLRQREQEILLGIEQTNSVIATGGSAVYSEPAMRHLRQLGHIVYLSASQTALEQRINNMKSRGIAKTPDQSFADIYAERTVLYERYAEFVLNTEAAVSLEQQAETLLARINQA